MPEPERQPRTVGDALRELDAEQRALWAAIEASFPGRLVDRAALWLLWCIARLLAWKARRG